VVKPDHRNGRDYSIEYRNIWPMAAALGRRPRAAVRRPDGSHQIPCSVFRPDITARRLRKSNAENLLAQLAAEAHGAGGTDGDARNSGSSSAPRFDEEVAAREKSAGAIAPGAADGDDRPAHRRRRP